MAENFYKQPDYVTKRLRYFDGQYLSVKDFIHEQSYHIDRQQRLARTLHVSGVLEGLVVEVDGSNIKIGAGSAIDQQGRQVLASTERSIAESDIKTASDVLLDKGKSFWLTLISEKELMPTDKQGSTEGADDFTRFEEQAVVQWLPVDTDDKIPTLSDGVLLAKVSKDAAGGTLSVDQSDCQYSGVYLPTVSGQTGPILRSGGNKEPGQVILSGELKINGNLVLSNSSTGSQIIFEQAGEENSQKQAWIGQPQKDSNDIAVMGGNFGIGVDNPGAKLHVQGDEILLSNLDHKQLKLRLNGDGVDIGTTTHDLYIKSEDHNILINHESNDGKVGIGTDNPQGSLHIISKSQDTDGTTLILGDTASSHLKLGYKSDNSWIQTGGDKPLRINPQENDVELGKSGSTIKVYGSLEANGGLTVSNDNSNANEGLTIRSGSLKFGTSNNSVDSIHTSTDIEGSDIEASDNTLITEKAMITYVNKKIDDAPINEEVKSLQTKFSNVEISNLFRMIRISGSGSQMDSNSIANKYGDEIVINLNTYDWSMVSCFANTNMGGGGARDLPVTYTHANSSWKVKFVTPPTYEPWTIVALFCNARIESFKILYTKS